ncbi:hypothetical protein VHEMI08802 [[Torrubiella] hemipterigena]|uniref:Short-chain dehydrogenase n=1 Tax=[Torrubiella] hemipterigena TaxID=1531966 RepID=A0A0A1TP83_9HYPO|nr:hypothetical protein VHEMI08802 [[Torrubiella] hemipterigena]
MMNIYSQHFPPKAHFTEASIPDLTGKVYIVTGSNTGIGKEVAKILYSRNATVWIAARDDQRATQAIDDIRNDHAESKGTLKYLHLDLSDLSTIPTSAQTFLRQETRLDALFNNAGVMIPSPGSATKQGYELQMGVNCLGHFLFTKVLNPILLDTAKSARSGSVRVIWVSSSAVEGLAPHGGVDMDNIEYTQERSVYAKYGISKAGCYFYATEFAHRVEGSGIISISLNPGELSTELDRTAPWWVVGIRRLKCYPPVFGAYTELFAAFSDEVTTTMPTAWIVPWGRFLPMRKDILEGAVSVAEGSTGIATKFWQWSEEQVAPYAK